MSDPNHPPDTFTAHTPEQARLLLGQPFQQVLSATMHGEVSASEAAHDAGLPLKQAHHRLTRLVAAGLVEVSGARPRGGRPVKLYRARAQSFLVPYDLTDAGTLEDLLERSAAPYIRASWRGIGKRSRTGLPQTVLIRNDAHGELSVNLNLEGDLRREPGVSGAFASYGEVHLIPATRAEAERRLRELGGWLSERGAVERHDPHAITCVVGLSFTPGQVQEG